jgi:tRNA-binding EMAP/Myf-like protein
VDSTRLEFAFLAGHERIKVKKLRGIVSQGLLVKAPSHAKEGDDVMADLGVRHYVPPADLVAGATGTSSSLASRSTSPRSSTG